MVALTCVQPPPLSGPPLAGAANVRFSFPFIFFQLSDNVRFKRSTSAACSKMIRRPFERNTRLPWGAE